MKAFSKGYSWVWKWIVNLFVVLFVLSLTIFVSLWPFLVRNQQKAYKPESIKLEFSGSIYKSDQVQPGTFAILRPWEEVKNWGKESILSYNIYGSFNCVAWTPNAKIPGTFLKSSWSFNPKLNWSFFTKKETTFNPDTLEIVIVPKVSNFEETFLLSVVTFCALLFVFILMFEGEFFKIIHMVFNPKLN